MLEQQPIELVSDELFLLGGVELVDARLSWYAPRTFGRHAPYNSYLIRTASECLLVESGVASHHHIIYAQLRQLLRNNERIKKIAVTRSEPECVCNIPNLVRDFGVEVMHSLPMMSALQFFPAKPHDLRASSFNLRSTELQMLEWGVECVSADAGESVVVAGEERLVPFQTPLRVLPTNWFYDKKTRTLFCSDSFSGSVSDTPAMRTTAEVPDEQELIEDTLDELKLKFDWLSRGRLSEIIETLEMYFSERSIEILAPTRGQVIVGAPAVAAHLNALSQALKALDVGVRA
jgi:flavorubredoxin